MTAICQIGYLREKTPKQNMVKSSLAKHQRKHQNTETAKHRNSETVKQRNIEKNRNKTPKHRNETPKHHFFQFFFSVSSRNTETGSFKLNRYITGDWESVDYCCSLAGMLCVAID